MFVESEFLNMPEPFKLTRVASLKTVADFRNHTGALGIDLPCEDAIAMAEEMGMPTGIDLPALIALARTLPALLGHDVPGQVMKAGRVCDLHPAPAGLVRT